jgi:hypothetical protein
MLVAHFLRAAAPPLALCSAQMMHVLAEHFGRDQGDAAVGDKKTLAILHRIDADFETRREHTISVDDALL